MMEAIIESGGRQNSFDSLITLAANEVNGSKISRQSCRDFDKLYDDEKIYRNLKKAILVCDHMDKGLIRNELRNLIEQSIQLFKVYHCADRDYSPLSPESPTSSMNPQLGIAEEVKTVGPQTHSERFIAPELSMISLDTEDNLDSRQSCLNLSPLRRFGIQLSQIFCSIGPYGRAAEPDTTTIVASVPNYDSPMSPSLQYFISQHREPPPTLPLDKFGFEENCRSTDADCDDNEIRNWTADEVVIKSPNHENNGIVSAEVCRIDYQQRPTEQRHLKRSQEFRKQRSLISSEPILKSQISLRLKNASRENKIRLLETATVIGLSLCKAFLIWRNIMLLFRKFRESYLNRSSTEETDFKKRRQRTSERTSLQDPTLAISTGLNSLDSRRCDDTSDGSSGYDCESNNSSNCDSASYISDEIENCDRSKDGIASDDRDLIDDANDALFLANRHSEDVAKSKSSRRSRSNLATARMQGDSNLISSSPDNIKLLNLDKGALSGTQSPWLNCLNSADDKEFEDSDGKMIECS
jgi:hypothetical protein